MTGTIGLKRLYFGTTVGKTFNFREGLYTDDSTDICLRLRTKNYYPAGPGNRFEIQDIYVFSDEPQNATISISLDNKVYEVIGTVQKTVERFPVWKKCYQFSLGIDEMSSNNIKIKGFLVTYNPLPEIL